MPRKYRQGPRSKPIVQVGKPIVVIKRQLLYRGPEQRADERRKLDRRTNDTEGPLEPQKGRRKTAWRPFDSRDINRLKSTQFEFLRMEFNQEGTEHTKFLPLIALVKDPTKPFYTISEIMNEMKERAREFKGRKINADIFCVTHYRISTEESKRKEEYVRLRLKLDHTTNEFTYSTTSRIADNRVTTRRKNKAVIYERRSQP